MLGRPKNVARWASHGGTRRVEVVVGGGGQFGDFVICIFAPVPTRLAGGAHAFSRGSVRLVFGDVTAGRRAALTETEGTDKTGGGERTPGTEVRRRVGEALPRRCTGAAKFSRVETSNAPPPQHVFREPTLCPALI